MNALATGGTSERGSRQRLKKLVLLLGFLAFTFGVVEAYRNPATGYELSILTATPMAFWVGVGVAILVGMIVSLGSVSSWLRSGALVLMGMAALAVAGLPLVRGYYFYGSGDALSHLGFARAFVSGTASPENLLHPGVHLIAIIVESTGAMPLETAFMLMVAAFFLAFLLFVPMTVRAITGSDLGLVVGTFAAVLLLPINSVSVHVSTHPTSQAILFLPFILYLLVNYVSPVSGGRRFLKISAVGVLLALSSVGVLLFHPQQALNVILVFGTIVGIQLLAWRHRSDHPFAAHRKLYGQTVFLTVLFVLWAPRSERTTNTIDALIASLLGSPAVGDEIAGRGASLGTLGGSLGELFVKLFLVSLVISAIAGVFILLSLVGRYDERLPQRNAYVKYFGLALAPIFGVFVVYFLASATTQHFRHVGFMMAIVTVISAVAITYVIGMGELGEQIPWGYVQIGLVMFFALLLPISLAAVHPSPFIYQDSSQVTEAQMNGFQTAFDVRDGDIAFSGIRGGPRRYVEALIYGQNTTEATEFPGLKSEIPEEEFNTGALTTLYEDGRYIPITEGSVQRETELYRGFRYSEEGFDAFETTPGINRVVTNGEFNLYLVRDSTPA